MGKTECSFHAKRPKFSVPEFEKNDLKNRCKFQIPVYGLTSSKKMKNWAKFFIPSYTSYRNGEVNKSKNSKFCLFKDLKTFKDKSRHSMPSAFSEGWGVTWFSVPKIAEGIRKTSTKMSIPEDFNYSQRKTNFKLPQPISNDEMHDVGRVASFVTKDTRFSIPEPGNLLNSTKQVSISECQVKAFRAGTFLDCTKGCDLIDISRNFKLSMTCELENKNRGHEFNEMEIDCSQLSI